MGLYSLFNKVCICYVFSYKLWEDWRIVLPGMLFVVVLRQIKIESYLWDKFNSVGKIQSYKEKKKITKNKNLA